MKSMDDTLYHIKTFRIKLGVLFTINSIFNSCFWREKRHGCTLEEVTSIFIIYIRLEDISLFCLHCDHDGLGLPAYGYCKSCSKHLCETCLKLHRQETLSKYHILLDKNNMPQNQQVAVTNVQANQPNDLTQPCPKHEKEMIKFYCQDHKELPCHLCVTPEHKDTSCKVIYIPVISGQIIDSKEYTDILKAMDTITDKCQKSTEDTKTMTSKSNSSLTDVLANIKKFRKEVNQRLDELERQAEDAAKAIKQENDKNLKTVETTCDDVTKTLKTSSDSMKHLNTSKQADRLFMELNKAEQMIKDYENSINQLPAYDVKEYNFKPNEAISYLLETESSLGTLTPKTSPQPSPLQAVCTKTKQASHQGEICVKTSTDKARCNITGMTLLTPDLLIITDSSNKAIKMVDTSSQSITDQLQLDTSPQDVTAVTSTQIAVTLPNQSTVQFILVFSDKLTKKRSLKVDGNCFGISCYQDKLIVSFLNPAKIEVLGICGTKLITVNIFQHPEFVTTSQNSVFVSDSSMRTVTRLNWEGTVTGTYKGFKLPKGITQSNTGTVFVCDQVEGAIGEISSDCCTGQVVLCGLKNPRDVSWCVERSFLYFSCTAEDENHDYMQIYKLS